MEIPGFGDNWRLECRSGDEITERITFLRVKQDRADPIPVRLMAEDVLDDLRVEYEKKSERRELFKMVAVQTISQQQGKFFWDLKAADIIAESIFVAADEYEKEGAA